MTTYWFITGSMIIAGLVMLLPAIRKQEKKRAPVRDEQNIDIARENLNDLKSDLDNGRISQDKFERMRSEIERSLLDNVADTSNPQEQTSKSNKMLSLFSPMVIIVLLSIPAYFFIGNPDAIDAVQTSNSTGHADSAGSENNLPSVEEMVQRLREKLDNNPDNMNDWVMLGRTYMHLRQYLEASNAFSRAHELSGENPDIILYYADALAMSQKGKLGGKPYDLVLKALKINPAHPKGLWLAGMAAEEQGEYKQALEYWQTLKPMLANEKQAYDEISMLINRVVQKTGGKAASEPIVADTEKGTGKKSVKLNIEISASLKDKVSPDDAVFIFARAPDGSRVPIAASRKLVRELPLQISLDDTMSMTPDRRISDFEKVIIGARISKSGTAMSQSGDLTSSYTTVQTNSSDTVLIVIDQQIK